MPCVPSPSAGHTARGLSSRQRSAHAAQCRRAASSRQRTSRTLRTGPRAREISRYDGRLAPARWAASSALRHVTHFTRLPTPEPPAASCLTGAFTNALPGFRIGSHAWVIVNVDDSACGEPGNQPRARVGPQKAIAGSLRANVQIRVVRGSGRKPSARERCMSSVRCHPAWHAQCTQQGRRATGALRPPAETLRASRSGRAVIRRKGLVIFQRTRRGPLLCTRLAAGSAGALARPRVADTTLQRSTAGTSASHVALLRDD